MRKICGRLPLSREPTLSYFAPKVVLTKGVTSDQNLYQISGDVFPATKEEIIAKYKGTAHERKITGLLKGLPIEEAREEIMSIVGVGAGAETTAQWIQKELAGTPLHDVVSNRWINTHKLMHTRAPSGRSYQTEHTPEEILNLLQTLPAEKVNAIDLSGLLNTDSKIQLKNLFTTVLKHQIYKDIGVEEKATYFFDGMDAYLQDHKSVFASLPIVQGWGGSAPTLLDEVLEQLKKDAILLLAFDALHKQEMAIEKKRFRKFKLIYKNPQTGEETVLPFKDLKNPIDEQFDLSGCEDSGKYVAIYSGFRTDHIPENDDKAEVWFVSRAYLAAHINGVAAHYETVFHEWPIRIPAGIFWTDGWWSDKAGDCIYDVTEAYEELSINENLYKKYYKGRARAAVTRQLHPGQRMFKGRFLSRFVFNLN